MALSNNNHKTGGDCSTDNRRGTDRAGARSDALLRDVSRDITSPPQSPTWCRGVQNLTQALASPFPSKVLPVRGFLTDRPGAPAPGVLPGRGAAVRRCVHPAHPVLQTNGRQRTCSRRSCGRPACGWAQLGGRSGPVSPQPSEGQQRGEKFLQSHSFHRCHERCCCWRGGTCGRGIFISSSFPSPPSQNKLQPVRGGKDGSR